MQNQYKIMNSINKILFYSDIRKNCYTNRVCAKWNDLNDDMIESTTINSFKNKIDRKYQNFSMT